MISLVSRSSSILLLILVFNLVACQAGRVKRAYDEDDEDDILAKQRRLNKISEQIEQDKRQQAENVARNEKERESIIIILVQVIIGSVVLLIMIIAIYKCIKKNEQFYRQQGKQKIWTGQSLLTRLLSTRQCLSWSSRQVHVRLSSRTTESTWFNQVT